MINENFFQLNLGENKFLFNKMGMILDLYWTNKHMEIGHFTLNNNNSHKGQLMRLYQWCNS